MRDRQAIASVPLAACKIGLVTPSTLAMRSGWLGAAGSDCRSNPMENRHTATDANWSSDIQ
jgi:hypothetical protein